MNLLKVCRRSTFPMMFALGSVGPLSPLYNTQKQLPTLPKAGRKNLDGFKKPLETFRKLLDSFRKLR